MQWHLFTSTRNVAWHINACEVSLTIHSLAPDALEDERQDPQNMNNPVHPYVAFNISKSPSSFQGGEDVGKDGHHQILDSQITQHGAFKEQTRHQVAKLRPYKHWQ